MTAPPEGAADGLGWVAATRRWVTERRDHVTERVAHALEPVTPVRVVLAVARLFSSTASVSRSAEIAYYGVLSVIPFGVLLLTALGYAAEDLLESGWDAEALGKTLAEVGRGLLPGAGDELGEAVGMLVRDRGTLGVFGVVTVIMTASLVFGAINRALAVIFAVKGRSRLTSTLAFSVFLIALAGLLLLGVNAAVAWTTSAMSGGDAARTLEAAKSMRAQSPWLHLVLDATLALTFVFLVVTSVRVRVAWRHTIAGAALFVGGFELARAGFAFWLGSASRLNLVYGSLTGIVAGILWAYYVALVLLAAMCLVRVLRDESYRGPMGSPSRPSANSAAHL